MPRTCKWHLNTDTLEFGKHLYALERWFRRESAVYAAYTRKIRTNYLESCIV